jgi:hypothetical protein
MSAATRTLVKAASLAAAGLFSVAALAGCADNNASPASSAATPSVEMRDVHRSTPFAGPKANTGYVTHRTDDGKMVLTLSDDFKVPQTPAPHWQVVDSNGNTYLLQRLVIKEDKYHKTITVPAYVPDVAKVQIWCAWAEVNLGEAAFAAPMHRNPSPFVKR